SGRTGGQPPVRPGFGGATGHARDARGACHQGARTMRAPPGTPGGPGLRDAEPGHSPCGTQVYPPKITAWGRSPAETDLVQSRDLVGVGASRTLFGALDAAPGDDAGVLERGGLKH